MFCAISGSVPKEPCVAPKTGLLYERSLIEKALAADGKCPASGIELGAEDLTTLKPSMVVLPRPPESTSIPGLLNVFQNEWDALVLETFNTRQQLVDVRRELSQALYQHDAACRVIARLTKERDESRAALSSASASVASAAVSSVPAAAAAAGGAMEVEGGDSTLSAAVTESMLARSKELSKERKAKKKALKAAGGVEAAGGVSLPDAVREWGEVSSHTLHKTSSPGVTCVDVHPSNASLVMTGGMDKDAKVFDRTAGKVVATLSGHSKKVTAVAFHPSANVVFTCSQDKTAKIWSASAKKGKNAYGCTATIEAHSGEVTDCSVQATGEYVVTCSTDATWAFSSVSTGAGLLTVEDKASKGFTCTSFHPDGLLLGAGCKDGAVRIWDVRSNGSIVATFDKEKEGHTEAVLGLAFSENGYHLASAGKDGAAKLWDLRKLSGSTVAELAKKKEWFTSCAWDKAGLYLALGSNNGTATVKLAKDWSDLATFKTAKSVTGVKFAPGASFLAATSMDRTVKFYGA